MDDLIDAIRAAGLADASPDARAKGIAACRTILTALEAQAGEPMAATAVPAPIPDGSQIAAVVGALRGVPPDQLLDLAIARLRAVLPPDAVVPKVTPLKFHIVPLPRRG